MKQSAINASRATIKRWMFLMAVLLTLCICLPAAQAGYGYKVFEVLKDPLDEDGKLPLRILLIYTDANEYNYLGGFFNFSEGSEKQMLLIDEDCEGGRFKTCRFLVSEIPLDYKVCLYKSDQWSADEEGICIQSF